MSFNMPGNPYVAGLHDADAIDGPPVSDADRLLDAILAVAYELRTSNLIAAGDSSDDEIRARVGLPAWSWTVGQ